MPKKYSFKKKFWKKLKENSKKKFKWLFIKRLNLKKCNSKT